MASNDREDRPLQPRRDDGAASIREQVLRAELLKLKLAYKDDVDSLGAKIDALDGQIASLNAQIVSLNGQIASLNAQIASLGEREQQLVVSLEERNRQIEHLNTVVAEREANIRAIYASWSWKFSIPVRVASRLVKFIVKGLSRHAPAAPPPNADVAQLAQADQAPPPAAPADQAPPAAPAEPAVASESPAAAAPAQAPAQDIAGLWSRFSSGPASASRKAFVAVGQWPPQAVAEARLNLFMDFFAQSKRPVLLASLAPPSGQPVSPGMTGDVSCAACGLHKIEDLLAAEGAELQYALLIGAGTADTLLPLVRLHCPWVRVIVDLGDSLLCNGRPERTDAAKAKMERRQNIEARVAADADLVLASSDLHKASLLTQAPDAVIEVLPAPIDMPRADLPGAAARSRVVCITEMADGAALDWLVDVVWPAVRSEMPDAALTIVGADPDKSPAAPTARPGVELVASPLDLRAILLQARVLVAPAQTADDVSMSAVLGLACGLPLVATPAIASRLGRQAEVDALVAADPELFAQHVIRLLRDDSLWTRMHTSVLKLAQARFSSEAVRKTIGGLFHA